MAEQTDSAYPPGAWVFVSHSHKDLPRVRQIRDVLERLGYKGEIRHLDRRCRRFKSRCPLRNC